METQIIIEGYKFCGEKGARFNKFVGDGDSSTYKALRDLQLYNDPYVMIEKFECVNHLFRNFLKQFKALLRSSKMSIKGRNLLTVEIGNYNITIKLQLKCVTIVVILIFRHYPHIRLSTSDIFILLDNDDSVSTTN